MFASPAFVGAALALVAGVASAPRAVGAPAVAASPLCSGRPLVAGNTFDRVVVLTFENEARADVLADPTFAAVARAGVNHAAYSAVAHPSQPNYIAYVSGSTQGVTDDGVHNLTGVSIADRLEAKGISWASYAEALPYSSFTNATDGQPSSYARKHEPFISFNNIANDAARVKNIKPATEFGSALRSGRLEQFVYYVPTLANDGHDTNVTFAGKYLADFLGQYGDALQRSNTLVHITFDEAEPYAAPNVVYSVLLGGAVPSGKLGATDSTAYNHYSMLATVERNWALAPLVAAADGAAAPFASTWGKKVQKC